MSLEKEDTGFAPAPGNTSDEMRIDNVLPTSLLKLTIFINPLAIPKVTKKALLEET